MTRIGAVYNPYENPPEALRGAVEAAEAAGVPELWIWEDCFRESAFATAAAALAWTERLHLGIGIAPMPLRNVAATAMEVATIERTFPGRLHPGVGHGVLSWMAQVGAKVASPLTLMRECVPALRALLAGEEVTVAGRYVTLDHVRLDWPPGAAPPVYAAGEGPRTLALAGEVADGVILTGSRTPAEFGEQIRHVREGGVGVARESMPAVVAYVVAAFGDGAEQRVRSSSGELGATGERGVWGDVSEVTAGVQRFADAGVDAVVLVPADGEGDLASFLRSVGEVARNLGGSGPHGVGGVGR